MGRRSFLEQTAATVLADPDVHYCLVDYSCPDFCGEWIERSFATKQRRGRIVVERVAPRDYFNKCEALNAGTRRAIAEGAEYLCFLDADTIVKRGFWDWLRLNLQGGRFLITALDDEDYDVPSLTGVLAVTADDFVSTSGFDESFRGWGAEDVEMRLRLHLLHGLQFGEIPLSLVCALPHGDTTRTRFYSEKDKEISNRLNAERMMRKATMWLKTDPNDLTTARRLMYQARPTPVEREPEDARKLIELAQMYAACGRFDDAIRAYEARIALGGWDEALWFCMLQVGIIKLKAGLSWDAARHDLEMAAQYRPTRAEPLWVLAVCSREQNRHEEAYDYGCRASVIQEPQDVLGVQRDVYQWRATEEVALAAMALGRFREARTCLRTLLLTEAVPEEERARIQANEDICVMQARMAEARSRDPGECVEALVHIPIFRPPDGDHELAHQRLELHLACLDSYFAHGNINDVLITTDDPSIRDVLNAYRNSSGHAFELRLVERQELRLAFDIADGLSQQDTLASKYFPIVRGLAERIIHIDFDTLFLAKVNFGPLFSHDISLVNNPFHGNTPWCPTISERSFFRIQRSAMPPNKNRINAGVFGVRASARELLEDEVRYYLHNYREALESGITENADDTMMNALALREPRHVATIRDYTFNQLAHQLDQDPEWENLGQIIHFHVINPHTVTSVANRIPCTLNNAFQIHNDLYRATLLWCLHLHSACDGLPYRFGTLGRMPLDFIRHKLSHLRVMQTHKGTADVQHSKNQRTG